MGHTQDLWYSPGPDGQDRPTPRHGHGRRWKARYADPDGRERSKAFARKADAEKFLATTEADLLRGTYLDPDAGKVTLRRYATDWLAARPVEITTRATMAGRVDNHILPVLGGKRLDQLARSPSLIQAWVTGLSVGTSYAADIFSTLSSILAAALDDGLIARNPCKAPSVRAPKAPPHVVVPWVPAQVAAVRSALPGRFQAMTDCGAGLGLRQGEILGLGVDAVEFLRRKVTVRMQVRIIGGRDLVFAPPKGGREREVPLPQGVSEALAEHIRCFPPLEITLPWRTPDGKPRTAMLLFTSHGHAVNRNWLNQSVWRPARAKAGIPLTRANGMHVLRHTYASVLLQSGRVDIRRLSAYLGHHDPAFTLRKYAHLMPDAEEQNLRDIETALQPDGTRTAQEAEEGQ
jgi:integrase